MKTDKPKWNLLTIFLFVVVGEAMFIQPFVMGVAFLLAIF